MAIYEDVYQTLIAISRRKNRRRAQPVSEQKRGAPWWQVYLTTAIFLIALFAIPVLIPSSTSRILEISLVVLYYGTVLRWVKRHEATLNQEALKNAEPNDFRN